MGCSGGCGRSCRQFYLLMWKNFLLQIRRPIGTIFELVLPVFAIVVVIGIRYAFFDTVDNCFVTFEPDTLQLPPTNTTIFYAPNNADAVGVMGLLERRFPQATLLAHATESDMITSLKEWRRDYVDQFSNSDDVDTDRIVRFDSCVNGYGIVFDNLNGSKLRYTIRPAHEVEGEEGDITWDTDIAQPRFQVPGPRVSPNLYLSEGFLHIQNLVGMSIIEWTVKKNDPLYPFNEIPVNTKQFPYPPHTRNPYLEQLEQFMPLLLVLSLIWPAGIFVWELVSEKQTRIRESMKMMGLSQFILWLTWYIKQLMFLFVTVLIMTILMKIFVFVESDFILLLIYMFLFINCLIAQGFLVSVFFSRAILGLLFGFLLWFIAFVPYFFIQDRYEQLSTGEKIGACFLSNTCMGLGVNVLSTLEIREEGVQWDNFGKALSADDDFNLLAVYGMFILDFFLYMIIAWYIDAVFPGEYGIPKPFYFVFLPSYWLGRPVVSQRTIDTDSALEMQLTADRNAHEQEPSDLQCGISITGLTKVYKAAVGKKVAVDNLNLNMYQDQITVLLGHNGAGKTTTMSMLVGLFPPTSGDAIINGYSILTDIDGVRESLGLCPQHNVLFGRLTVREHLSFFARLKGMTGQAVREEVNSMINDLQLVDKTNQKSASLSGGQKRKLSVGIALVAGSQFVILDEPTSGMDPYARRATWDLLTKHKQGRTILLTTHFMDEADLLGDRIAIMAEGQLGCSGSSLFLKSKYGVGYHMVVTKESYCNSAAVIQCVTSTVRGGEMVTDVGAELSFVLPSEAAPYFPALFDTLEARKRELGISGFGISVTTMEEVFIKVGEGSNMERSKFGPASTSEEPPVSQNGMSVNHKNSTSSESYPLVDRNQEFEPTAFGPSEGGVPVFDQNFDLNTGIILWIQQFYGLLVKRFLHSIRNWRAIITQLVVPIIFILLGLILVHTVPGTDSPDESRSLNIPDSALEDDIIAFYAELGSGDPIFTNTRESEYRRAIGATELRDITANVEGLVNETRNRVLGFMDDCCNYTYQILDTFCASQNFNELEITCRGRNFGYSRCSKCLRCQETTLPSEHLATCSYPRTRGTVHYEDTPFCPYPPSIPITESLPIEADDSQPLDFMTYYVDEHLLHLSDGRVDTTEFFRRYMAGFVISKRESAVSHCASKHVRDMNNDVVDTRDLMCYMLSVNPVVQNESFFFDSVARQNMIDSDNECLSYQDAVQCASFSLIDQPRSVYPNCSNAMLIGTNFVPSDDTFDASLVEASFRVDGAVRQASDTHEVDQQDLVGRQYATIRNTEITGATIYYNNQPFHMPAAALNAFHTIYLRHLLQDSGATDTGYTITVNNHPLPRTDDGLVDSAEQNFLGFALSILVMFGLAFLAASFILYPVAENSSKAKHIQFVSGVHITSFWMSAYLWDLINAFVPIIAAVILFAAFPIDSYRENLGAVFLLFFFFCWSSIPLVYVLSFIFTVAPVAFAITVLMYFFSALISLLVVFFLNEDDSEIAHYILITLPSYAFAEAIGQIHTNFVIKEACEQSGGVCEARGLLYTDNIFDLKYPGIGANFLSMALGGAVFFVITLLLEQRFFLHKIVRLCITQSTTKAVVCAHDDSDVAQEKNRMNSGALSNDLIQLKNLNKVYGGYLSGCQYHVGTHAVKGLNLGIPKGECFGLLGVNGAGKTTTFNMLTGDTIPSSGTALIAGYDIVSDIRKVQQHIGYCPQFDALIDDMTGYELLWLYARLRGIPEGKIREAVDAEIKRLDLLKYAKNQCGTYSGGNKRKLSTAVALVGSPQIVLLDEPTTGMDPATRRHLWDALITVIKAGKSIVLTSHSMEECEALCTRLAIMVNGEFKCLGGIQHLKTKFGKGVTLQVKIGSPDDFIGAVTESVLTRGGSVRQQLGRPQSPTVGYSPSQGDSVSVVTDGLPIQLQNFMNFIENTFERATLVEHHLGSITYQLEGQNLSWSHIFRVLEQNRQNLLIVDYSVSQTTLEQVFINFAKDQLFD